MRITTVPIIRVEFWDARDNRNGTDEKFLCSSGLEADLLITKLVANIESKGFKLVDNVDNRVLYYRRNNDLDQIRIVRNDEHKHHECNIDDFVNKISNVTDAMFKI